jgi:predicted aldo/keto reductase-like oxidoreductase
MKKIRFGKTNLMVSKIAFGGIPIMRLSKPEAARVVREVLDLDINFIDTATGYNDSEEKIGEAIRDIPRESLVIASKSPANDKKTFATHLELSLKRLGVDYIDIYQLHNVNTRERHSAVFGPGGAFEGLTDAIKAGKVRFPGFSSHSIPMAVDIMKSGRFAAVQLPINFIDTAAEEEAVPLAKELDIGFIAMKPMGGGLLENAGPAIRYLMRHDHLVPDPGIEKIEQMREIVDIVDNPRPLSAEEWKEIEALRKELGAEWCHRCDYCQPCPQGIKISSVLIVKSFMKRMPLERAYQFLNEAVTHAADCTECRDCMTRCPYGLEIPELLKKNRIIWEEATAGLVRAK